jgi:glycolate oxidase FAD binding subunit
VADQGDALLQRVEAALADRTPLRIVGGGSKDFMGREAGGEPVSTADHSGLVEYEPTELVVCVRAGTTIAELDAMLAANGQCLGCDPPRFGGATVGGTLACNQSGPARPWMGSIRDHVLGLRLINGRGELLRFGGRVMKNVAGYDVSRLQAGAMGTLGLITEVTLRVFPKPESEATATLEMGAARAVEAIGSEASRGGPLSGACWHDGRLYLRFAGLEPAVQQRLRAVGGETVDSGTGFWSGLREQEHGFFADGKEPLWRVSCRAGASLDGDEHRLIDWAGAQRWQRGEQVRAAMEKMARIGGGEASLYRGGDRRGEVFHEPGAGRKRVLLGLKKAFDPQGIFNPGRLYSWM